MEPDKDQGAAREEFEVAYYTKELGRPLQRQLLQRRLTDLSHRAIMAASHGEEVDVALELDAPLPRQDRAG